MIPTTNRAVTRSSVLRCRWQMTLTFIAALAMLPAITGAQAVQGAQKDAGLQLEEIIVTAQKRKENAQEVPIAITAVSGKSLQQMGLGNVADLSGHVPNIDIKNTVSFAGSSQILVAAIRGIGQNDFAFNLEPGVGVYIDGVYYARSLGAVVDLLDLERIEVLKGPQGTLFGRNTIGGALNVVTRDPEKEFKSQLEATTGRFNRTDLRASIDVPLIDNTLLSQLSFSSKRRDGYQKRIPFPGQAGTISDEGNFLTAGTPGGSDTQGGENSLNVRGKFKWIPSDNFKVLLSGDYTNARQEARPATLIKTFAGPTDGTALTAYNGCIFGAAPPFICSKRGTVNTSFFGVNVDADPNNNRLPVSDAFVNGNIDSSYARGSNYDNLESWGLSATADWTLSDDMSLKSITAYRTLDSTFGSEIAAAPIVANDASFAMNQLQFSEELQFNLNSFDQRLRSVFGLYYFRESGGLTDYVVFGEGLIQVYGPNDFKNKAFAAFMHENLAITEQWGLTLGVRLTDEKKEFEGFQHDLNSFFIRTRGVDPNGPLPARRYRVQIHGRCDDVLLVFAGFQVWRLDDASARCDPGQQRCRPEVQSGESGYERNRRQVGAAGSSPSAQRGHVLHRLQGYASHGFQRNISGVFECGQVQDRRLRGRGASQDGESELECRWWPFECPLYRAGPDQGDFSDHQQSREHAKMDGNTQRDVRFPPAKQLAANRGRGLFLQDQHLAGCRKFAVPEVG